jgi:tRNA (guanine-N7-)-methyltransferase
VGSRRLDRDIPGPDRRVAPTEVLEKGWEAIFAPDLAAPLRLVVEIGFGRGEFLLTLAERQAETAFVGIEVSYKRAHKMARRLARMDLGNVRLLAESAERAVEELLAPGSVAEFWINFSDPWPKKRHHKRRLIQPSFVGDLATRLVPGGTLEIATDDPGYAEWIDAVLAGEPRLANANAPEPHVRDVPGRMRTSFEEEWRGKGRIPYFWTYRRIADAPTPPEVPRERP